MFTAAPVFLGLYENDKNVQSPQDRKHKMRNVQAAKWISPLKVVMLLRQGELGWLQ
jgi:hypothetical protein